MSEHNKVNDQLSVISSSTRPELIEHWSSIYRGPPPKGISRRLLAYSVAFHIQAKAFGGLKPAVKAKLRPLAQVKKAMSKPKAQYLQPGARLMREWHGQTYTVDVTEHGFSFGGQDYATLSQVARTITGARWSGPRFFGL